MSGIARDNLMTTGRGARALRTMRPWDLAQAIAGAAILTGIFLGVLFLLG